MLIKLERNISLEKYTTLRVGGPAKFFCEVRNEEEILEAVKFAEEKNLPIFFLGGGSNILVSDKGFNGLVIKILNSQFSILNSSLECGAGCQLGTIVNESAKAGLSGIEWAAGIPGTIGGAVRGNAGAFGSEMVNCVESVRILEIPNRITNKSSTFSSQQRSCRDSSKSNLELQVTSYKLQDCQFAYRDSIFKQNPNLVILSATLKLRRGDKKEGERKIKEIIVKRKEAQPSDFPSSGSFFKNPIAKDKKLLKEYREDTGSALKDNVIPAGYLIDRLDFRGKKIGGAMVSHKHGNFLVNAGKAKAEDFVILAAVIKTRVRNKFGIQLKEEVQMVGF